MRDKEWEDYISKADLSADYDKIREYARVYFIEKNEYQKERFNRRLATFSLTLMIVGTISIAYNLINIFILH